MDIYKDEVFGPARMIISVQSLEQAIKLINKHKYGNGVTIFTNSGKAAHKFKQDIKVGMVGINVRSEEHTSELQSRGHLVCRLLLEKKKNIKRKNNGDH